MRRAAHIDKNQPAIVKGLRALGMSVQPLSAVGKGCPDLLVGFQGQNWLVEVKNPLRANGSRKDEFTPMQREWHGAWRGRVVVAETLEQAIERMGVKVDPQQRELAEAL